MSGQGRITERSKMPAGFDNSDTDSVKSSENLDLYCSPIFDRKFSNSFKSDLTRINRKVSEKVLKDSCNANWVSPKVSRRTKVDVLPFPNRLESSFDIDCSSSVISLDFGLVSPQKNWCSPPQRIERAQNREWSSPHRVIDRPNPENSPGNWISMKESCLPVRHSPTLGVKCSSVDDPIVVDKEPNFRPASQSTYVVLQTTRSEESNPKDDQPIRKISVLEDYEPERIVSAKKRTGGPQDPVESGFFTTNEKVRRIVDPSGHVIKISLLDDFEARNFGKNHDKPIDVKKETKDLCNKIRPVTKKTKVSDESLSTIKPLAKKKKEGAVEEKKRDDVALRKKEDSGKIDEKIEEVEAVREEISENKTKDIEKSTEKIIQDLKNILKSTNKENDKTVPVTTNKPKPKIFKQGPGVISEKPVENIQKRKRNIHPKEVQEYIKTQKQKRMEQVKTEKKTKDAEKEARKKKLEELRIKSLILAAQSKKKKVPQRSEIIEPEDDITVSLGLKQIKPKVSYNESISKLKNKFLKPQPPATPQERSDEADKTFENVETVEPDKNPDSTKPEDVSVTKPEEIQPKPVNDLNATLKKLADTLHSKLEKEKQLRSKPVSTASKSQRDSLSQIPSQETLGSVKSAPEANRQLVTVDLETIQTLKNDIKKISENFKILHEIIVDKADHSKKTSDRKESAKPSNQQKPNVEDDWLKSVQPISYPYNVFTAFQQKINLRTRSPVISQKSSTFAELSNKCENDFEALSKPSDRLPSVKHIVKTLKSSSCSASEENYFSLKNDSGSELSSSILDSEKQSIDRFLTSSTKSYTSSIATEITSKSIQLTMSKESNINSDKENLILVTPDLKLISNDLHEEKLNNYSSKNVNFNKTEPQTLNNSEKSYKEQKTDSTITELIDNFSENEKSTKIKNEKPQNVVQQLEEVRGRRSFFQPEVLHLQFQAELTLLETFQQSLTQFLEAERVKTLTEVNKIMCEKTLKAEKLVQMEDQAVQTSYVKEVQEKTSSEDTDSVKTEINLEEESIKTEKVLSKESDLTSEASEKRNFKIPQEEETFKHSETSDYSNNQTGISFHMLNRMMKDEELRSEHQLALIRLREKTLNEKVKAELTFLEMKKRALKEKDGDEEQNISAIKKKQRGILLKYQSEKEEIERLKKMHKIACEERKIMIKQQKQIQQMQNSTNDMIIRLKKSEKSPQRKKSPVKAEIPKKLSGRQSEISEEIQLVSDSILTDTEESRRSSYVDFDLSSRSVASDDSDIPTRNSLHRKLSQSLENFKSKKSQLEVEKYPRKRHSVEELLNWTKRLEEKENHLKELEKHTMDAANKAKNRLLKSLRNVKTMKDRSTSPFQFPESIKTISEISPSELVESKKSTSEPIESNIKTEMSEKSESIVEKIQSSASEDIPEQFSKKISNSRTTEYYSESFESPSSSETPKNKAEAAGTKPEISAHKSISIKLSLSPRMQSPRRRYSSGSDESVNLSHTETASEQSDLESRIAALHEQLRKKKLEAERLRREQKKAQRERLKVKEQSLLKQIQAYDAYIQKKKLELEQEYENTNQIIIKPLIKQPKVAEKFSLKRQEPVVMSEADKLGQQAKIMNINKEKVVDKESDSEIAEEIRDTSENIKEVMENSGSTEEIESKLEEESKTKNFDAEVTESFDAMKSTSVSESLPEQYESQSESEDQSVSIKTTLISPERPDTDALGTGEEETPEKEVIEDEGYQFDSFESYAEEKRETESLQKSIATESGVSEYIMEGESKIESSSISQTDLKKDGRSEKAEKIADSIIMGLILESLDVFLHKKTEAEKKLAEKSKLSLEALSSYLAKEIISEAVDEMIRIYNKKTSIIDAPERISTEVRKRITEIMSQSNGDQGRPQDLMVTTYDVSPFEDAVAEDGEREKFLESLTPRNKKQQGTCERGGSNQNPKIETISQQWIDDDFGLSRTRREAEELRLQQLQIEQEIQQLQAQQEQVPYFYLREIPNKPPPPYTPPGKPLSELPTSESEITSITSHALRILSDELNKGKEIANVEPSWDYYGDAVSEHLKCYKFFLFDLVKHIVSDLVQQQERKKENLPWMKTRENLSRFKYQKVERTFECLSDFVRKEVLILFGFGKKVSKESLIVRWIKKKRDHVDEILVGESQEEEAQWTRYDEDQITVKNEVTLAILDDLLEDTCCVISSIFNSKKKKLDSTRL